MRLFDKLMEATTTDFYGVRQATVIEATNVADYVYDHFDEYTCALFADICPCLAPPFENFFIEYRLPVEKILEWSKHSPDEQICKEVSIGVHGRVAPVTFTEGAPVEYQEEIKSCKWHVCFHLYEGVAGEIRMFDYAPVLHILEDGTALKDAERHTKASILDAFSNSVLTPDRASNEQINVLRSYMLPALLAISFMHCKNIKISEFNQTLSRQQRRYRERKGIDAPPPCKFRVINIAPMREVLRKEGNVEESGLARALHICRGHFANYDENGKLFGKYTGRFWIPMHVKGSAEAGKINQSYKVNAEGK